MQTVLDRDSRLYNPRIDVGQVRADLPTPVAWRPELVGGLVVMVDMQRWAMYGGGKTLDWAVGRLEQWVLDAAEAIGATAGFVTAVEEDSHPTGGCPWELSQHLGPGYRDAATTVWGFGWGTLVGPVQLAAVGGVDALAPVASSIRELSGGRLWVRIGGEDPAAVTTSELDALEDVL
jgi:hypothetical protein